MQPCFHAQNCGLLQMLYKNLWYKHLWYTCFKSKHATAWNLHPFQTYFWWVRTHLVKKPSPDKTILEQTPQNNYLGLSKEIICLFLIYGSPILGEIPTQNPPSTSMKPMALFLNIFSQRKASERIITVLCSHWSCLFSSSVLCTLSPCRLKMYWGQEPFCFTLFCSTPFTYSII